MNDYELIDSARGELNSAEKARNACQLKDYAKHMTAVVNLLLEELIGDPPNPPTPHPAKFNPEVVLMNIANAVRHRPISITERWQIIYYHTRICCVPHTMTVPQQIIIHTFTEQMARSGFTAAYWHQTKMNVIKLYKELES